MAGPSFRAAPVRIRVPATAANLGPGFDSLGLALGLYDDVVVRIADSGLHVDVAGEGADDLPRDKRHLVVRALRAAFDALGGQPRGLEVVCANRIPQSRGLGSSAAAIVAGVTAARHLVLGGISDDDVLALTAELEGHPDNVAACLLGGVTIAWRAGDGQVRVTRVDLHPALRAVVLVPNAKSSTAKARRLLPETVPHADAAWNAGRAALLVEALTRQPELLLEATDDRLHQPYRAEAMPRTAALVASLRAKGLAAAVAGAGPTVLVLGADRAALERVAAAPPRGWVAHALDADLGGAQAVPVG
ncbi:MAG TPA: homoserine kinase [Mycobacteriales bacterium]|nr:homoserine kinase [Mycobacteriales bacterium]